MPSDPGGNQPKELTDESEHLNTPKQTLKTNTFTNFATININSLAKVGKLKTLLDTAMEQRITILAIQEMRNTMQEPYESQGFRIYQGIPGKRVMKNVPQFGTGFIVENTIINSVKEFRAYTDRIATLTIRSANKTYTLVNVHAPTNEKNRTDPKPVEGFWNLLDQILTNIPSNHTKIVMGDFNAQIGREKKFRNIVGDWPAQKKTSTNGRRLIEICREHRMVIKSTRFKRRPHKKKTWKHTDWKKGEYQLDHVCMDKDHHKEIYNVKVLRGKDLGSDHYLSKIKIKITPAGKKKKRANRLKRTHDQTKIQNNTQYAMKTNTVQSDTELEELTEKLKAIAAEIAQPEKRKKHQWWDRVCEEAVDRRHEAWKKFQNNKTDENFAMLTQQRKLTQRTLRNSKRKYHHGLLDQIEDSFAKNNSRQYYRTFREKTKTFTPPTLMLKNKEGVTAHNDEENANIMAESFRNLLNCEDPINILDINTNTEVRTPEENIQAPSKSEVEMAIKQLKNNKASGEDQLTAELWKYAGENAVASLHKNIQKIWKEEKLPTRWTTAIICPIHKKGSKTDPGNYRGISLLDCTYKILSKIIYNRVRDQLEKELGEYQAGFRPGRSCPEQILNLKLIIDYYKSRNKQLVISFIDFQKAYDSIHRESLKKILKNLGLHPKLIKMIGLTLENTTSKVKFRGAISDAFEIKTGLRQGDGLSPILFNCALEYLMREWKKINPELIKVGTKIKVNCLGFADDLALLANSIKEARTQIETLEEIAGKIGLKISFEKTKIMVRDPLCVEHISICNTKVELVKKFKYLGETITHNNNEKINWKERTDKLKKSLFTTQNIYNKKCLSTKTKIRHYQTVILPEIQYACETISGPYKMGEIETIEKIERRIIRKCINKKNLVEGQWRIIPNETVYKTITPLTEFFRRKRISFLGHILRTEDTRLAKRLIDFYWNKKIKSNWVREVQKDMEELGILKEDLVTKSQKYSEWIKTNTITLTHKPKPRRNVVYSEEERRRRSERLKKIWAKKKEETAKQMKQLRTITGFELK